MKPRIEMVSALIVLAGVVAALGGAAYAQEIFAGGYKQQSGEDLYKGICQGCHMPDAKGAIGAGAYPALGNNARLVAAIYPITVVVNGQRAMPDFGADLSDEQIANVVNYIRTHFGNHYKDVVSPAAVKAARRPSEGSAQP
jgi:mono/diheme cytochrome c family protein